MDALLTSPLIPASGGIIVVTYLAWWSWRITRDIINPYREENHRLRNLITTKDAQLDEAEQLHQKSRTEAQACAAERERMRIAMHLHGVPWHPDDWTVTDD